MTDLTYTDIRRPSFEGDGAWDASSKPLTSTQVNTFITNCDTILSRLFPNATQTDIDIVTLDLVEQYIDNLVAYYQRKEAKQLEPGEMIPAFVPKLSKNDLWWKFLERSHQDGGEDQGGINVIDLR